jgi:hypothetical protein
MVHLKDSFGRTFPYFRISITSDSYVPLPEVIYLIEKLIKHYVELAVRFKQ